jgi:hypothetical protein
MLMCLFFIRGHKGLGFCQVLTEVIPLHFLFKYTFVQGRRVIMD